MCDSVRLLYLLTCLLACLLTYLLTAIGSDIKIRHTFIPPAMLPVVRAFMALPADATFSLEQLPAPDAFVKVCAVRQLMALHAVVFLPKEEAERWRRRRGFQDVDLRGVIG